MVSEGKEGVVEGMAVSRWEVGRMSDDSLATILKIIAWPPSLSDGSALDPNVR